MPRDGVRLASLFRYSLPESSRARVAVSAPKSMSLPTIVRSIYLQKRVGAPGSLN